MQRVLIGFTEPQRERLRHEAKRRKTTVAALVRDAVDRTYPDDAELRRDAHVRAMEVFGMFREGPSDISERHDDYLADAYFEDLRRHERRD
jgi:hypothetical protein